MGMVLKKNSRLEKCVSVIQKPVGLKDPVISCIAKTRLYWILRLHFVSLRMTMLFIY